MGGFLCLAWVQSLEVDGGDVMGVHSAVIDELESTLASKLLC